MCYPVRQLSFLQNSFGGKDCEIKNVQNCYEILVGWFFASVHVRLKTRNSILPMIVA